MAAPSMAVDGVGNTLPLKAHVDAILKVDAILITLVTTVGNNLPLEAHVDAIGKVLPT